MPAAHNDKLIYRQSSGAEIELVPEDATAVIQDRDVISATLERPNGAVGRWVRKPVTPVPPVTPTPPVVVVGPTPVPPTANLQQALDKGGTVALQRGATYPAASLSVPNGTLIAAVGDPAKPLPVLKISIGTGIELQGRSGVTLRDIELRCDKATAVGLHLYGSREIVLDGLRISGFTFGFTAENHCKNVRLTRSLICDNYNTAGRSSGGYSDGTEGLVIDGNVFDANGYKAGVAGATDQNQGVYLLGSSPPAVVTNNVFSRNSNFGIQCRCGGVVRGNLFIDQPNHMSFGYVAGAGPVHPGGVSGEVTGNVMVGSGKIGAAFGLSALTLSNILHAAVGGNIIAHGTGAQNAAISVQPCGLFGPDKNAYVKSGDPLGKPVGVLSLAFLANAVWDWPKGPYQMTGLTKDGVGNNKLGTCTPQANWNPKNTVNLRTMLGADVIDRFRRDGASKLPATLAVLRQAAGAQ